MISCYIIGELPTVKEIRELVKHFAFAMLKGHSSDLSIDLNAILALKPDIVFLEASFIPKFKQKLIQIAQVSNIIVVSENSSDAFDAFEVAAFDYLLQPLEVKRFEKSINRLIQAYFTQKRTEHITDSFFIKPDAKEHKEILVKCNEVSHIEAFKNYVVLHMVNGKMLTCHNTMKEMEDSLPESCFIRVHKSFIINYDKVTSIEGNSICLNDNERHKILIGSTYRKTFFDRKNQKMIKKQKHSFQFDYSATASVLLFYIGLFVNYFDYFDQNIISIF